ncbi:MULTISPECIES: TonB-dependent receptor [Olivibacter]|uniref:TonB-dependent receptor n=1 Tax=Olivibacter jilunii TaxID=985016 RepID=A0ABW6AXG7_9SPHI|nr:TonB-dependent receptor [Olivibacter sp. UJ_SKK_5.1]MDX3913674.1 TonB-dependent receptor [Pseudosphingobacterium sp.]
MYKINAVIWHKGQTYAKFKPILIMKLSLILILIGLLEAKATAFAQKLTLHKKNVSLQEVFDEIRKQSGYNVLYTASVLKNTTPVNIDLENVSVTHAIDACLANQGLSYKIVEKNIVISKKNWAVVAQEEVTLTGKVTDNNGKALAGVSISIKGLNKRGTQTDEQGFFTLKTPPNTTLVVTYIGFQRQELKLVSGQTTVNVQLEAEDAALDEVVVVGYGTQRKSDLTGSVSSVSAEKIAAFPVAGTAQALQGRSPGVAVSSVNGEPGKAPRVRIRGGTSINASSDPLYVVDGFAGGTPPPPEDVESVEVLKDASATAIYGSRGANGVIMVTTKKGKVGRPIIDFNNSYSIQKIGKRLDLLNGQEFAEYINDVYRNSGNSNVPYSDPSSYGEGTDWQDLIFRTGGLINNQLSVSGGSENIRYYTSLSHYGQKGTVINSDFRRLSGTSNLDIKVSDRVRLGTKLFFIRNDLDGVRTQETSSGTSGAGVISGALRFDPLQGVYDANGKYTLKQVGDPHDNPVAVARERKNEQINDLFQGNAYGELELLQGLKFRSTLGVQISNQRNGSYVTQNLVEGRNYGGSGSIIGRKNTNVINENFLTYTKSFQDVHNLEAMGGYSYQSSRNEMWESRNRNFVSDNFSFWNLGAGSNYQNAASELIDWVMSSFYGRINYNFKGKYLLTVTGRYDGSSRFGDNNKWAFFPSGALAWNISQEPFMQSVKAISNLKIRTSYGETGNTEIGSYMSLARFSPTLATINGTPIKAVRPTNVANPNLTWETTKQTDAGLDIGFLNGRINLSVDYYYKKTVDLLYEVPLPIYSGYTVSLQNIGSVENKGWEFALNTTNVKGENFTWTSDFNITFNRNKILQLPGGDIRYNTIPGHMLSTESQILRVGEVVGAFYGWLFDGLYQEGDDFSAAPNKKPGDVKYRDIYGRDANNNLTEGPNGVINADDRTIIGNPHPDFIYGFNNDLRYKNFDLNIFFQGSQGNDMLNITRMELDWMAGKGNATKDALNRWTPTNTNTDIPRASASNNPEVSSRWVEDGSYLRLKNVALGYNFPKFMLGKLQVSKLRIYASAQNILTVTNYKGYDPEVSFQDSNRNVGLDYMGYPNVKSVTLGINVGF